jgi:hypothetical protein
MDGLQLPKVCICFIEGSRPDTEEGRLAVKMPQNPSALSLLFLSVCAIIIPRVEHTVFLASQQSHLHVSLCRVNSHLPSGGRYHYPNNIVHISPETPRYAGWKWSAVDLIDGNAVFEIAKLKALFGRSLPSFSRGSISVHFGLPTFPDFFFKGRFSFRVANLHLYALSGS